MIVEIAIGVALGCGLFVAICVAIDAAGTAWERWRWSKFRARQERKI